MYRYHLGINGYTEAHTGRALVALEQLARCAGQIHSIAVCIYIYIYSTESAQNETDYSVFCSTLHFSIPFPYIHSHKHAHRHTLIARIFSAANMRVCVCSKVSAASFVYAKPMDDGIANTAGVTYIVLA